MKALDYAAILLIIVLFYFTVIAGIPIWIPIAMAVAYAIVLSGDTLGKDK